MNDFSHTKRDVKQRLRITKVRLEGASTQVSLLADQALTLFEKLLVNDLKGLLAQAMVKVEELKKGLLE
jgi:hypothetical protein